MDPSWGGSLTLTLLSALALASFLSGVARPWLPRAAPLFVAGVAVGYVVLLIVTASYVAACPSCTSHISSDSSRLIDFVVAIMWGGLFTAGIASCAWAGTLSAALFRRLQR